MKKAFIVLVIIALIFAQSSIFCACTANNRYDGELLRLHIRANSNSAADQAVKLEVRDAVNAYICRNVDKDTFEEAYADISSRLGDITRIAIGVLRAKGFSYGARALLTNEYFPARQYGDTLVEDGYYDALIIELGDAAGDNWWCVIYPPLCYGEDERFEYKSFFAELFS